MKPMLIDFSSPRSAWRWDLRMRGTQLFVLLLLASAILGALALERGAQLERQLIETRAASAQLQAKRERSAMAERDRVRLGAEDDTMLRQSALQRGLPWEAVFQAFERAPLARLQSFEPDLARGVVKVQAHMADVAALQDYLRTLQTSPVFMRVTLLRHEAPAEGGVNFHYEAVLAAPYRLPEPEQRKSP